MSARLGGLSSFLFSCTVYALKYNLRKQRPARTDSNHDTGNTSWRMLLSNNEEERGIGFSGGIGIERNKVDMIIVYLVEQLEKICQHNPSRKLQRGESLFVFAKT